MFFEVSSLEIASKEISIQELFILSGSGIQYSMLVWNVLLRNIAFKINISLVILCFRWAHQVRSHGRNIAVNIWWTPFKTFNSSDCKGQHLTFIILCYFHKDSVCFSFHCYIRFPSSFKLMQTASNLSLQKYMNLCQPKNIITLKTVILDNEVFKFL